MSLSINLSSKSKKNGIFLHIFKNYSEKTKSSPLCNTFPVSKVEHKARFKEWYKVQSSVELTIFWTFSLFQSGSKKNVVEWCIIISRFHREVYSEALIQMPTRIKESYAKNSTRSGTNYKPLDSVHCCYSEETKNVILLQDLKMSRQNWHLILHVGTVLINNRNPVVYSIHTV